MSDARPRAIDGWKEIGVAVGRCDRTCRAFAARPNDPLPVFKVGGMVRLLTADLDAWLERQRAAPRLRSARRKVRVLPPHIEEHW